MTYNTTLIKKLKLLNFFFASLGRITMNKTVIIIPSRLDALRLPNKPLKLINNKEMILHVYEAALKSNADEVYVATPDQKIIDRVKKIGGNGVLTEDSHLTGTDRIFEVFKKNLNSNDFITRETAELEIKSKERELDALIQEQQSKNFLRFFDY